MNFGFNNPAFNYAGGFGVPGYGFNQQPISMPPQQQQPGFGGGYSMPPMFPMGGPYSYGMSGMPGMNGMQQSMQQPGYNWRNFFYQPMQGFRPSGLISAPPNSGFGGGGGNPGVSPDMPWRNNDSGGGS
jgi:hypothetical protein